MDEARRVRVWRHALEAAADRAMPLVDLSRPYVDGLDALPSDGRFLVVGNHTQSSNEAFLIPFFVRRAIGIRVRPLTDRRLGHIGGPFADLFAAAGAVVGDPATTRELMRNGEPILVFPGGAREVPKFKGEENTVRWQGRAGFARLAVENNYPIVTAALLGGDEVYRSIFTRDGWWGRLSEAVTERVSGSRDMAPPLMLGIGPTLIPRPQRMYLRFASPIQTAVPPGVATDDWVATVKRRTQESLEQTMADLVAVRRGDPYRELDFRARRRAVQPVAAASQVFCRSSSSTAGAEKPSG